MDEKDITGWLYDHGYFWVPGTSPLIKKEVAMAFSIEGHTVKSALMACQAFCYSTMNFYAEEHYKEPHRITGRCGDVTERYMGTSRCSLPDFPPPFNATFGYPDASLQMGAVLSMQKHAAGAGSWPSPCQDDGHGITFRVNKDDMSSALDDEIEEIIRSVINGYAERSVPLIRIAKNEVGANIRVSWERNLGGGGTIGLGQFNNQDCDDSVFCKLLSSWHPSPGKVAQLLAHEIGHNCNLPHTPDGVMRPNLQDEWKGFTDGDPSVPRLQRYFGTKPVEREPPGPPEGDDVRIEGIQTVTVNGKKIGTFISREFVSV